MYESITDLVADINSKFDPGDACIQFAKIPPNLKLLFESVITAGLDYDGKNNLTTNPALNYAYEDWLNDTFFDINKNITQKTDITIRIQEPGGINYSLWHREFRNPELTYTWPVANNVASNTHIVLYYPVLTNCKENGGTRIRYNINGEYTEVSLPADTDTVYCLRDCCFSHMSPQTIPVDATKPIVRVIVRSYVTPDGWRWEPSKYPDSSDWDGRGRKSTNKKRKYKVNSKTIKKFKRLQEKRIKKKIRRLKYSSYFV